MEDKKLPLVSIIIPCYNYGHLLADTLNNIKEQSYSNWECFIIDDNSTDNTAAVATSFSDKDARFCYLHQQNLGPAAARNLGLSKAKGEYIQFLDADDLLENKKIEQQIALFLSHPEYDIVYSNVKYFKNNNPTVLYDDITLEGSKPWMKKISGKGDDVLLPLLKGNIMVINSPLIRKKMFDEYGNFNELLRYNEDWELWIRFARNNAIFAYDETNGTQALVRVHDSYSKDNFMMFTYGLQVCIDCSKVLKAYRYKKILLPKINYHKRIIDEKLIHIMQTDKNKALQWILLISIQLQSARYKFYNMLFPILPVAFCKAITKLFFMANKFKNTIIYGA